MSGVKTSYCAKGSHKKKKRSISSHRAHSIICKWFVFKFPKLSMHTILSANHGFPFYLMFITSDNHFNDLLSKLLG